MPVHLLLTAAQIKAWMPYDGIALEHAQRTGKLKGQRLDEMYRVDGIVNRLRTQLYIVATGRASQNFAKAASEDLMASTADDAARQLVRQLVDADVQSKATHG
jgi:hypothetical protein